MARQLDFGGPPGALAISLAVPAAAYWLNIVCAPAFDCALSSHAFDIPALSRSSSFFSLNASALYALWYAYLGLAWAALPARLVQGTLLRSGDRLSYRINAFKTLILTILLTALVFFIWRHPPFIYIVDHYPEFISASLIMSFLQACYCYWSSFQPGRLLALGGNSGSVLYDWFIGRELNPRVFNQSFDIKTFNEMRPGLILWILLDFCWLIKQYQNFNHISNSSILVFLFHFWYVFDAEYNEDTIFTQMDITTDGFGFMLSVGDLTWVPFTYSLQLVYLSFAPVHLSHLQVFMILGVQLLGYYIFRTSNQEKNDFRHKSQNPKGLKFMETQRGTKLITSGWWGRSRHPNYLGDWIMAWAWCLPTGFKTPIPYFYVIYFAILLIHRQLRDDHFCEIKYGQQDWNKYKQIVRWRIIPFVY